MPIQTVSVPVHYLLNHRMEPVAKYRTRVKAVQLRPECCIPSHLNHQTHSHTQYEHDAAKRPEYQTPIIPSRSKSKDKNTETIELAITHTSRTHQRQ